MSRPLRQKLTELFDPAARAAAEREARAHEADLAAAKALFARLQELEAAFDPQAVELYGEDGVAIEIERAAEDGAERRRRETPLRRYKRELPDGLRRAKLARLTATHENIRAERIAPGWVILTSTRRLSHSRAPAAYELVVRREGDGVWRIAKETATLVL
jgi:predicted NBD/HSP70 family sugar kinase